MIRINRIDHIGMAVPDLGPQIELMTGLFGFKPLHVRENAADNYRALTLEIPGDGEIRWELLEPVGSDSSLQEFIDGPRGPGVHHVTFEVNDAAEIEAGLSNAGVETVQGFRAGEVAVRPVPDGNGFLFRFAEPSALPNGTPIEQRSQGDNPESVGIVGLDHLCHAHPDRDALGNWYERVLGMRQIWRTPDGEHSDMADLVMETPGNGMYWEVIQPVGEESFLQRFLDRRGPSIHHATFKVNDWDRAVAACEEYGAPLFDENTGTTDGAAWSDAFIHPRNTGGILVQLFWEQKPGVWIRSDKVRPNGWEQ